MSDAPGAVPSAPESIRQLIDRAIAAHDRLADFAESIEDEWTYVNELRATWADRLSEVAESRPDALAEPGASGALDEAVAEVELISDPHRAIDWLSTFPMIVLLALNERT